MAGDPLRRAVSGRQQRIPTEAYNAFVEAAAAERAGRFDRGTAFGDDVRQAGVIKVRNDTDDPRARGEILALGAPLVLPSADLREFQRQVAMGGDLPDSTTGKFAVLIDPIAPGRIGRAVASGIAFALVEADGDTDFADSESGNAVLQSAAAGAQVLWREDGSGQKWAVVRLPVSGATAVQWYGGQVATASLATSTSAAQPFQNGSVRQSHSTMWTSGSPTRIYVPYDGHYHIAATVRFSYDLVGTRAARFELNGTPTGGYGLVQLAPTPGGVETIVPLSYTFNELNADDYIEVYASHNSSGPLDVAVNRAQLHYISNIAMANA
jgi:hypothetical protein